MFVQTIQSFMWVQTLVSPAGGTAITVNAGPGDKLKITNLNIAGAQQGSVGIVFNSGKQLWLENVELHGFASGTAIGLNFIPSSAASGRKSNWAIRSQL